MSKKRSFGYNPVTDRSDIDPVGFIDLRHAYESGTVTGDISFASESFNGVLEPSAMMHRPLDAFEALRQQSYVKSALAAAKQNASEQPSGPAE